MLKFSAQPTGTVISRRWAGVENYRLREEERDRAEREREREREGGREGGGGDWRGLSAGKTTSHAEHPLRSK